MVGIYNEGAPNIHQINGGEDIVITVYDVHPIAVKLIRFFISLGPKNISGRKEWAPTL